MMKTQQLTTTVRRSVALPRSLVEEVAAAAPPGLQGNLNRLVTVALQEFVARRKNKMFRQAMAEMAADPAIQAENAAIAREFAAAEGDGLSHDQTR
jgi:hypothetical protein